MKKQLLKKLSQPEINRSRVWFWEQKIKPYITINGEPIKYGYFMGMLNGTSTMRDDVKEAINEFLKQG